MRSLFQLVRGHCRLLLFALAGVTMFALCFGVWGRVLPPVPRSVIPGGGWFAPMCFSEDGRFLYGAAAWGESRTALHWKKWDVETGQAVALDADPDDLIVAFAQEQRQLIDLGAVPNLASKLRFLEHDNDTQRFRRVAEDRLVVSYLSRTGRQMKDTTGGVILWDLIHDKEVLARNSDLTGTLSPNAHLLATAPRHGGTTINLWSARDGTHLFEMNLGCKTDGAYMIFSPDGRRLLIAADRTHQIWRLDPPQGVYEREFPAMPYLSTDWKYALTYDLENGTYQIRIHGLDSGNEVGKISTEASEAETVTFIPFFVPRSHWVALYARTRIDDANPASSWWRSLLGRPPSARKPDLRSLRLYRPGTWKASSAIVPAEEFPMLSHDGAVLAMASFEKEGEITIWDVPPRRQMGFCLILAAVPALLVMIIGWWCLGRGREPAAEGR